ncbi:lipocalin family protein, partial [Escherichia coli]|nr:lipocalin family protein [Escherichia coli]
MELPGPCPTNIRGIANFNAANYLGTWYEIARYPVEFQFGQCSR